MIQTKRLRLMLVMLFAFTGSLFVTSCGDDDSTTPTPTPEPELSSDKDITSFIFSDLDPAVEATISGTDIAATLPFDTDVTALAPTIAISAEATVSPASGAAQDFSAPVTYTVTAEDESTQAYTVTVTLEAPPTIVLSPKWQRTLAEGGLPSWFTANNDRDLAAHGDFVYVHNNNDKIRVLSSLDGSDLSAGVDGDLDNPDLLFINGKENFATGNLFLLNVATDDNGVIVGSNLRNGNGTNAWNVYSWADKDASQELLFGGYVPLEGEALADNLSVVGSIEGDGFIYAPADGFGGASNAVLKFTITGGVVNPEPLKIELAGFEQIGNGNDAYPTSSASDASIIVAGTSVGGISEYNQAGELIGKLDADALNNDETAPLFTFALDVVPFEISGRKLIATTATDFTENAANAGWVYLIDYTDGLENVTADQIKRFAFTPEGNIDTNFNGTGGVDVVVNENTATVYAMLTNFGVLAVDVTIE